MKLLVQALIGWPQRVASHFLWAGPLLARVSIGYIFMLTGWGKLNNLMFITENFRGWGIPAAEIMAPLASGIEFVGGIALMLGLVTRIFGGALAVTMVVAIVSAKWEDVDSLSSLLWFEESAYFIIFTWLAITGAGKASLDYLLERKYLSM